MLAHVMSSILSLIDRECTSLYPHSVVNFALYRTVWKIFSIFCPCFIRQFGNFPLAEVLRLVVLASHDTKVISRVTIFDARQLQ